MSELESVSNESRFRTISFRIYIGSEAAPPPVELMLGFGLCLSLNLDRK